MEKHAYQKRKKSGRVLLLILFIILLSIVVAKYAYKPRTSKPNTTNNPVKVVATSTPPASKPTPLKKPYISISPTELQQGEPVLITVTGLTSTTSVKSFTFDNRPLLMFMNDGYVSALMGVDLRAAYGTFPVVLTMSDGTQIKENMVIGERALVQRPFDIPEKLGGNTRESEKELIRTLAEEGKIINTVFTTREKLWTEKFGLPLKQSLVVEDPFGYTRIVGKTTMPHKGTDIVATMGTPVYAMNRGIVRLTQNLRNYGNTVIIDHGAGVETVYMHLSEIDVTPGQMVEKGERIALSGDTGYTLNPHLHLTIRIWDISIDAMKFLELFGENS